MRPLLPGPELADPLTPYRDAGRPPPEGRPWILANMVCGIDGSTAVQGRVGALSSATDRRLFLDLRSVADVVLVGAETVRRERYGPVELRPELLEERRAAGRTPAPRVAVVSRSLVFADDLPLFASISEDGSGDRPIIVTSASSDRSRREALAEVADVLVAGDERVDLAAAMHRFTTDGVATVLCEGGPSLLGDLIAGSMLDELCLTVAPMAGGDPLPLAVLPADAGLRRAELAHVLRAGDDLFLRYLLDREAS